MDPFREKAYQWWDPNGAFFQLHRMNPIRMKFVFDTVSEIYSNDVTADISGSKLKNDIDPNNSDQTKIFLTNLKQQSALDIGCGGGLATEALSRLCLDTKGIDESPEAIEIAKFHAAEADLTIDYQCISASELFNGEKRYDLILALEVIEHVEDANDFVSTCTELLKPNGVLIISTLNRSMKSYLGAIVGAEYILNWVPKGTHEWNKFIKPKELSHMLLANNLNPKRIKGMVINPLTGVWSLSDDMGINYIIAAQK